MRAELLHSFDGHAGPVYASAFDRDARTLYTGGGDGMVGSWDLAQNVPGPFSVKVGKAVYSLLADTRTNKLYVGQSAGGIHVVDRGAKAEIRHLKYHEGPVFDQLFNRRHNHLYSVGGEGALCIVDAEDYRLLWSMPLSNSKLRALCLSPSNETLYVAASDGRIRMMDTTYFNELSTIDAHEGGVYAMIFLPDGTLLSGGRDGHLRFWNVDSGELNPVNAIPAHNYAVYSLELSPSGRFVVSGSRDRKVKIWPIGDWEHPIRIQRSGTTGHTHSVNTVGWVSDEVVYSLGDDRRLFLWKMADALSIPKTSR